MPSSRVRPLPLFLCSRGLLNGGGPAFVFASVAALLFCGAALFGAQGSEKTGRQSAAYVGSETCQACHEDIYNAFLKSPHGAVEKQTRRGWEGKACESCHGPGSVHAESVAAADIRNPAKLPVSEADRTCLSCHLNQATQAGRIQSGHGKNQVSCASCHSVHKTGPEALVARKAPTINQQCVGCHTPVWASFQRPHKHRLPEGAMSCVDCHNPHGSFFPMMQRSFTANEPGCLKCHGDKRGPFAFEHAPVRLEGCSACHQPHGSANPRMLTRHEVRLVCLECHANLPLPTSVGLGGVPPAFHDMRSPRFRNCTICHVKVHGSHVNRSLLR